MSTKSDINQF